MVQPEPIHKVMPENPHSRPGSVLLFILVDKHGHVTKATVGQSAGQALDDAAVTAAMQWEFRPKLIRGEPVNGGTILGLTAARHSSLNLVPSVSLTEPIIVTGFINPYPANLPSQVRAL